MKKISMLLTMTLAFSLLGTAANYSYAAETLRIISWETNLPKDKIQEFENYVSKKYDKTITIETQYASDEQNFYNAIRGRTADVAMVSHHLLNDERYNYIKNKYILPINLENVPNYKTLLPVFKKMEAHVENGLVYSVPFAAGPHGLYYNADIVKLEPNSWSIFWDKRYVGKYAVSYEHYESNVYITLMGLGRDMRNNESISIRKNIVSDEYISRFKALANNADHLYDIYEKAERIKDLAFSTGWGSAVTELNKQGRNWKLANPAEGTMGWVDGYMIGYSLSQDDKQRDVKLLKKVAEDWINFTLSPKFQLYFTIRNTSAYPTNLSIKSLLTPAQITSLHLDDLSYFDDNLILFPTLTTGQRRSMKRLWNTTFKKNAL